MGDKESDSWNQYSLNQQKQEWLDYTLKFNLKYGIKERALIPAPYAKGSKDKIILETIHHCDIDWYQNKNGKHHTLARKSPS